MRSGFSLFFFLLIVSTHVFGQNIRGTIQDAEGAPLEFASVRLFSSKDSTVVQGIYSIEDGSFVLNKVKYGNYYLKISFSNFETHVVDPVVIDSKKNIDLGLVVLNLDKVLELEGVTATGSLDVLKAGIDKKIYVVADDISAKGGNVNDVLNNIPSIDVDQDGNISLRGDGNVTILIDGRPSGLILGDGQNLLDALPANSIERIEVVTNPSAKYDPDGTSGIINIVMKKNKLKGFNGIVSATAATGDLYEGNFAVSYRNKRFNTYLNYSFNYYEGSRNFSSELYRNVGTDSSINLFQDRIGTDFKTGNTLVVGTDFYINKRNVFGFSVTGSLGQRKRTGDLENRLYDNNDLLIDRWDRISEDPRRNRNFDLNLNHIFKLKEEKGEWSFNANQSFGDRDIQGFYEELYYDAIENITNEAPLNQQLDNQQTNGNTTIQTDFEYILKKIQARIEAGAKMNLRTDNILTYSETLDTLTGVYAEDTLANFDYKFKGSVYSLYAIFGQERGKFKYQAGVRGEYAEQFPQLISSNTSNLKTYVNLFPSAHVRYDLSAVSELSLSYSRRINRPKSRQLNPFTSYADPFNLRSGNPDLDPEYIDSYDFGYAFTKKKIILSASFFHRRTKDVINRVKLYRDNNTAIVTYDNIDKSVSTGFEAVLIYRAFL
ncbi:MAG: TonB-dependent receptor [Crocinitomicaceae bacterium]|nr:TonB-dependent receptor [Crocinitomicaceae bacterium]